MHIESNAMKPLPAGKPRMLATDLDGTLIPLAGQTQNVFDLLCLERARRDDGFLLAFVTGRHCELAQEAIREHGLPIPDVLVTDVGTSVYEQHEGEWVCSSDYVDRLEAIAPASTFEDLRNDFQDVSGLRLQEEEKQGLFKLSFYVEQEHLEDLTQQVQEELKQKPQQFDLIASVDPFNGDGLIDIVPHGVSKAFAIDWLREHEQLKRDEVIFAGDSGNDFAALTSGVLAIVVGNATDRLKNELRAAVEQLGFSDRLYVATNKATSGVWEGACQFGLTEPKPRLGANRLDVVTNVDANFAAETFQFAVWAPSCNHAVLEIRQDENWQATELSRNDDGVHHASLSLIRSDSRYRFRLEHGDPRPDPRSRFQPNGVHGASAVIDPSAYNWSDAEWPGVPRDELVIYELHIGTLTSEGTYRSAIGELDRIFQLGVTAIELMPVAACPGRWNWGYDGVDLFAPSSNYGTPDDLRALVDAAHAVGLAVILDVVYNHLGPEGNYLAEFGPYFSPRHQTPWGDGINFDGSNSDPVRDLIVDNAIYWLDEFHLDGLRLDAVHAIVDRSERSILADVRRAVTAYAAVVDRPIHLIAETNIVDFNLLDDRNETTAPYDAVWADDLMHAIYSAVAPDAKHTQRPYEGMHDIAACLRTGYLYHGLPEERVDVGATAVAREPFVIALQNHDVVGNDPHGRRIHHLSSVDTQLTAAALTLLSPSIPLLFMGEEFSADQPFHFFTDFGDASLRQAVEAGRESEYPAIADHDAMSPNSDRAFHESVLVAEENHTTRWYRRLLSIRRNWRRAGLLTSAGLTARCDADRGLFEMIYSDGVEQRFVIVRLADASNTDPVEIAINGEILADSRNDIFEEVRVASNESRRIVLANESAAIVGSGVVGR